VLAFELAKPPEGVPAAMPWRVRLRHGAARLVHDVLRRGGYDLVRLRARPTYVEELSRYASQLSAADLGVQPGSIVLDVGGGHYPFPHATILSELHMGPTHHRTEPLVRDGRPFVVLDVAHLPFCTQSLDFVYCSHVLEHVPDPGRACTELQRVGREGYIETPTFGKDVLFAWAEGMHRWHVVAIGDRLVFFEYTARQAQGIRSTAWWDTIFGDTYHPLQEVFHANQDLFNVAFRWRGRFAWTVYHLNGRVETCDASPGPGRP
jgi:SAM-dependent methyltransferase